MSEIDTTSGDGHVKNLCQKLTNVSLCYSPLRYWVAFIASTSCLGVNISSSVNYYHDCPRDATFSPGNIWYCLMTAFLGNFAVFHLIFIIGRFMKKTPVKGVYDSGIERAFRIPMVLNLLVLIGVSIWGIVLAITGTSCDGDKDMNRGMSKKAIIFLLVSSFFIVRSFMDRFDKTRANVEH